MNNNSAEGGLVCGARGAVVEKGQHSNAGRLNIESTAERLKQTNLQTTTTKLARHSTKALTPVITTRIRQAIECAHMQVQYIHLRELNEVTGRMSNAYALKSPTKRFFENISEC